MNRYSVRFAAAALAVLATIGALAAFANLDGGWIAGTVAASANLNSNKAATTLPLVDDRSVAQVSTAAERPANNMGMGFFGRSCLPWPRKFARGYSDSAAGDVDFAAFADSYNRMIKPLPFKESTDGENGSASWPQRE